MGAYRDELLISTKAGYDMWEGPYGNWGSRIKKDGRFLKEEDITTDVLERIQRLNEIAKDREQSLAQMALSWVLKDDDVTSVLIGASKPEQILENVKIVNSSNFTKEELEAINHIVGL